MTDEPLVSIVIPVYNGANYLREAIDSALAQTYPRVEVIVVNDGSTDKGKTEQIARSYGEKIRYFSKENGGVSTALNLGIKEMRGEYFSWLSHDDLYYPNKIQTQVDFMREIARDDIIVYCDYDIIDENSRLRGTVTVKHIGPKEFKLEFISGGIVHGCTPLVPRACFERFGVFDPHLRYTQDYDLWFRLSAGYEFHHVKRPLIKSRQHSEQGSAPTNAAFVDACNDLHISLLRRIPFEEIRRRYPQDPARYALSYSSRMQRYRFCRAARYARFVALILAIRYAYVDMPVTVRRALQYARRIATWSWLRMTSITVCRWLLTLVASRRRRHPSHLI